MSQRETASPDRGGDYWTSAANDICAGERGNEGAVETVITVSNSYGRKS